MVTRRAALVLPLFAVALAACSDDGTSPEEPRLTSAEATALAQALDELGIVAIDAGISGEQDANLMLLPNRGIAAQVIGEEQFTYSTNCPRGGSAAVEGELQLRAVEGEEDSFVFDAAAIQTHTECGMRTSGTVDLFVDGSLQFVAQRELRDERLSSTQTHAGALDFEITDGKEGRCDIDMASELTLEDNVLTRVVAGNVCGHNVDARSTWTVE